MLITQNAETSRHTARQASRHDRLERNMPLWKVPNEGCNRAVVVSVAQYDPGVSLKRRPGAKMDGKKLHRTLSKLGFKVDLHMDLTGDEIYELFQKGASTFTSTCLFFVFEKQNCTSRHIFCTC